MKPIFKDLWLCNRWSFKLEVSAVLTLCCLLFAQPYTWFMALLLCSVHTISFWVHSWHMKIHQDHSGAWLQSSRQHSFLSHLILSDTHQVDLIWIVCHCVEDPHSRQLQVIVEFIVQGERSDNLIFATEICHVNLVRKGSDWPRCCNYLHM